MATVGRETNWALPFATLSRSNLCPREPTNFVPSEQYEQSVDFQFIVQKSISINNFIDSSSWSLIWKDTSSYSYFFREIILYWNERVVKWPLSLWLFCKITDVAIIGKFLRILFGEKRRRWTRYRVIIARFWGGWKLHGFFLSKLAEVILKQEVCLITPRVKRIACASLSLSKTCRLIKTDAALAMDHFRGYWTASNAFIRSWIMV